MPARTIYWQEPDGTPNHYRVSDEHRARMWRIALRQRGCKIVHPLYADDGTTVLGYTE